MEIARALCPGDQGLEVIFVTAFERFAADASTGCSLALNTRGGGMRIREAEGRIAELEAMRAEPRAEPDDAPSL